jgi:hypothetical protein
MQTNLDIEVIKEAVWLIGQQQIAERSRCLTERFWARWRIWNFRRQKYVEAVEKNTSPLGILFRRGMCDEAAAAVWSMN